MTHDEVLAILRKDILIYTAAIHWNVVRSASNNAPPKVIYIEEFIGEVARRITNGFDPSILNKKSVLHLANWFTEHLIREEYGRLVNKPHDSHNPEDGC